MDSKIRFGDLLRQISVRQKKLNMNALFEKTQKSTDGKLIPQKTKKIKLSGQAIYNVLAPYLSSRLIEQLQSVLPLAAYLMLFQLFVLRQNVDEASIICGGLLAVMVGLMFFMEGLRLGLMPLGEKIGHLLPVKSSLPVVLLVAFLLGVGCTFAEPAIGALKAAGATVKPELAPVLFAILNLHTTTLVLMVGAGVGLAAILGTLRFVNDWSLKPLIYASLIPTMILTGYIGMFHPEVTKAIGLAWDCGAVTTGPVTVPLVLALGIGVAGAVGSGNDSLSGFGIVTLASIFPILGALILGLYIDITSTPEAIISAAKALQLTNEVTWADATPWTEIIAAIRSILPLVLFLFCVMFLVLKEKRSGLGIIYYGIILSLIGMAIFNIGLTYGLAKLGDQAGSLVPAAFTSLDSIPNSPLYWHHAGMLIALLFTFFLGLRATLAEPALKVLGMTVEQLTEGAFKQSVLMYAVAFGVGVGITVGVCKLIFNLNILYLILPGYCLLLFLTYISTEEFVNIAWDSAGVTTGPVTVPLVLALGLGLGSATGIVEGFGILSMASLFPILSVLCTGLFVQSKAKNKEII